MTFERSYRSVVRDAFAFMESNYGYSGPANESFSSMAVATYRNETLEMSVQLEHRDRIVMVEFQGPPGVQPPEWRFELGRVLAVRAPREFLHRRILESTSDLAAVREHLVGVADLVETYCGDILAGNTEIFERLKSAKRHLEDQTRRP